MAYRRRIHSNRPCVKCGEACAIKRHNRRQPEAKCAICGLDIPLNTPIAWPKQGTERKTWHPCCIALAKASGAAQDEPADDTDPEPDPEPTSAPRDAGRSPLADAIRAEIDTAIEEYGLGDINVDEIRDGLKADLAKLAEGLVSPRIELKLDSTRIATIESTHPSAKLVAYCLAAKTHMYVWGDPGNGKSEFFIRLAKQLGLTYEYCSLSPQSPESRIVGFIDANSRIVDSAFRRSWINGGMCVVEEADNMSALLQAVLNVALANGIASFPDGNFPMHPDFVFVGIGNTPGLGGTPAFPERRPMDAAFRDRFSVIRWDLDPKLEASIARGYIDACDDQERKARIAAWTSYVPKLRAALKSSDPQILVTMRATKDGAKLLAAGATIPDVADMRIFSSCDPDTKRRIIDANPLPVC